MSNGYIQRGVIVFGVILLGVSLKIIGQQTYDRGEGAFKREYEPQLFIALQQVSPLRDTPCAFLNGYTWNLYTWSGGTVTSILTTNIMAPHHFVLIDTIRCLKSQNVWTEEQSIEFLSKYNKAKGQNGIAQGFLGNVLLAIGCLGAFSIRNK